MNKDTHGATGKEWIGFDLDGTLAKYDGWKGIDNIGEPVKPMVDLIKKLHDEGKVVKILTARVAPRIRDDGTVGEDFVKMTFLEMNKFLNYPKTPDELVGHEGSVISASARFFIRNWCQKHLGFVPEITHEKDQLMTDLYDDRVKQVVTNEGTLVEDDANAMVDAMVRVHNILQGADDKNWADCIRQAQVEMSEFI